MRGGGEKKMSGVKSNNRAMKRETTNMGIYSLMLQHRIVKGTISHKIIWGRSVAKEETF